MRNYCATFALTLVSWSKAAHEMEITVKEEVTLERQHEIASAMSQQLASNLVQVITKPKS